MNTDISERLGSPAVTPHQLFYLKAQPTEIHEQADRHTGRPGNTFDAMAPVPKRLSIPPKRDQHFRGDHGTALGNPWPMTRTPSVFICGQKTESTDEHRYPQAMRIICVNPRPAVLFQGAADRNSRAGIAAYLSLSGSSDTAPDATAPASRRPAIPPKRDRRSSTSYGHSNSALG